MLSNVLGHLLLTDWPEMMFIAMPVVAVVAGLTSRWQLSRRVLWIGLAIFVAAWVPLLSAMTGWAGDNPVGLGLLAWIGSGLGMIVIAVGLLLRLWEFVRPS